VLAPQAQGFAAFSGGLIEFGPVVVGAVEQAVLFEQQAGLCPAGPDLLSREG